MIGPDLRDHDASEKLYVPDAYTMEVQSGGVLKLLDHLVVAQIDGLGHSTGAGSRSISRCVIPRASGR